MDNGVTTVQVSSGARDKLRKIAKFNLRSMASHLEWLINREYDDLQRFRITEKGVAALEEDGEAD